MTKGNVQHFLLNTMLMRMISCMFTEHSKKITKSSPVKG